jgi:large subunit ribosomal protein L30e
MSSYRRRGNLKKKSRKRTSAKSLWNPDKELKVAVKTGKCLIGFKETMRELAMGELKLIVVANNAPPKVTRRIELLNRCLSDPIPVFTSANSSWDLGAVMGHPYWVSCLGIIDVGDSSIIKVIEKVKEQQEQQEQQRKPHQIGTEVF